MGGFGLKGLRTWLRLSRGLRLDKRLQRELLIRSGTRKGAEAALNEAILRLLLRDPVICVRGKEFFVWQRGKALPMNQVPEEELAEVRERLRGLSLFKRSW